MSFFTLNYCMIVITIYGESAKINSKNLFRYFSRSFLTLNKYHDYNSYLGVGGKEQK